MSKKRKTGKKVTGQKKKATKRNYKGSSPKTEENLFGHPGETTEEKKARRKKIVELRKKLGRPSPKELGVSPYPYPEILDKNPLWEYQSKLSTYFLKELKIPICPIPGDEKPNFEEAALYFGYEVESLNDKQRAEIEEAMETFEKLQNLTKPFKYKTQENLEQWGYFNPEIYQDLQGKLGDSVPTGSPIASLFCGIMGFKLFSECYKSELEAFEQTNPRQIDALEFIQDQRRQIIERLRGYEKTTKRTFTLPSHSLMFSLLALFAGKPERIPRALLRKPEREMTPEEKRKAHKLIDSILEQGPNITEFDDNCKVVEKPGPVYAIICDNKKVKAKAQLDKNLMLFEDGIQEESRLAVYIKRTFGAEGLRHLLGIMIALDDQGRTGEISWDINKHLELLGYKKKKRAFRKRDKETALEILKIFTGLNLTRVERKDNPKEVPEVYWQKLLQIDGGKGNLFRDGPVPTKLELRATKFWYQNAFEPPDGKAPQFTKLLRKIVTENHRERPLTLYLAPLLAIFWRMSPERKISVKLLMDWCDLDYADWKKTDRLKDLEAELSYMREKGYLGEWVNNGENPLPSECKDPFECMLTFYRPQWLDEEVRTIESKKEKYLPKQKKAISGPVLTKEEIQQILEKSKLTTKQFALKLGISREYFSRLKNGKRKIKQEISDKIREVFGDFLEEKHN